MDLPILSIRIFHPATNITPSVPASLCRRNTAHFVRYTPQKNKQRLQMKKVRRKRMNPPGTKMEKQKENKTLPGGVDGSEGAVSA